MLSVTTADLAWLVVGAITSGGAAGMWIGYLLARPGPATADLEVEPTVSLDLIPGRHRDHTPAPLARTVLAARQRVPAPPPPAWATAPTRSAPHVDPAAVIADVRARRTGELSRITDGSS